MKQNSMSKRVSKIVSDNGLKDDPTFKEDPKPFLLMRGGGTEKTENSGFGLRRQL